MSEGYFKVFDNFKELFDKLSTEGLFDGFDKSQEKVHQAHAYSIHDIGFPDWISKKYNVKEYEEIKKYFTEPNFREYLNKPYCSVPFIGEILSRNMNIKRSIRDAYDRCMHPNEYVEYDSGRHRCRTGHVIVNGAFVVRQEFEAIEEKIANNDYYGWLTEDIAKNGWIDYAKGFQVGYDTFEKDYVDKPELLSNTTQDKAQRIIDYLSNPFKGGFAEFVNKSGSRMLWYETGVEYGRIYHAWYIIMSNYQLFEDCFMDDDAQQSQNVMTMPPEKINEILNQLVPNVIKDEYSKNMEAALTTGKTDKIIDIHGRYKVFSDIVYPHWNKGIPQKHYKSWYDFVMNNFTFKGKDVKRTTISGAINRDHW